MSNTTLYDKAKGNFELQKSIAELIDLKEQNLEKIKLISTGNSCKISFPNMIEVDVYFMSLQKIQELLIEDETKEIERLKNEFVKLTK
ncbi:MAG: hypothetical protein E6Q68_03265 [Polynucleobacter sp.]|nr:MAG: hypothetical protein E6Q68_03265 [Polynucleobacter sp.]